MKKIILPFLLSFSLIAAPLFAQGPLTLGVVSADVPAGTTWPVGTVIHATATASGGVPPYQYRWSSYAWVDASSDFQDVQGWSTNPDIAYALPDSTVNYVYLRVQIRNAGSMAPEGETDAGWLVFYTTPAVPAPPPPPPPPPAQTPPAAGNITAYDLGVWTSAQNPTTDVPFSIIRYQMSAIECNRTNMTDDEPDGVPNPHYAYFDDPDNAGKACRFNIYQAVLGLPLGIGYRVGARSVVAGTPELVSAWDVYPKTFRRAPRGLPCANGDGVEATVEVDINGAPVRLTMCIQ